MANSRAPLMIPLAAMLIFAGEGACSTKPPVTGTTADEAAYLEALERDGTSVVIPESERNAAWGRAQTFIAAHAGYRLAVVSDFILDTPGPRGAAAFFYQVTRTVLPDGNSRVDVRCTFGDPLAGMELRAVQNAKVLAHYIKTGELKERFVSHRNYGEKK